MPRWIALVVVFALSFAACKTKIVPERAGVASCAKDDDCTFYCESKGSCCHNPYCEQPALTTEARAIEEYNRDHCTPADQEKCPQIGSREPVDYTSLPRCRAGTCVVERTPRDGSVLP